MGWGDYGQGGGGWCGGGGYGGFYGGGYGGLGGSGWTTPYSSDYAAVGNTVLCQVSDWFGDYGGNSAENPIQFSIQQSFQTTNYNISATVQGTVAPIDVGFSINIFGFQIPILNLHLSGQ